MLLMKPSAVTSDFLNTGQGSMPLIICKDAPRIWKKLDEAGYREVQVNAALSKKLLEYGREDRPKYVDEVLKSVLNERVPMLVTRFEMLFDPRYEIDVLKFFCEKARFAPIAVKWPGAYSAGKLTYADPEYPDYHEFDCNAYQIRIVL